MVEAEQEADPAAPVVGDEIDLVDPQRVEQRDDVGGHRVLGVAVARLVGPAEAAQVGGDHAVARREQGNDVAPLPPVLRPAVEQQHGRLVAAGVGHVEPDAVGLDPGVLDARDRGRLPHTSESWRGPGPMYLAVGRISRASRFCSRMWADQPAVRAHTNSGVNSAGGTSA